MRTALLAFAALVLTLAGALGSDGTAAQTPSAQTSPDPAALWVAPADLEARNLFLGPATGPPPPDARTAFVFVAEDKTGRSPGFDVRDANGIEWSVKLGVEAQSEVVASRILWAIGFHQPPTYYLPEWTMTGQQAGPQPAGRFRPDVAAEKAVVDRWEWNRNPFTGTRPMAGLLVAQMILNNWDLKDSNNKIYEVTGSTGGTSRKYVVRDLGASLGHNRQAQVMRWTGLRGSQGSKNDLEGFEKTTLIDEVTGDRVKFTYRGPNDNLLAHITTADVRWTAALMARLSDAQWQDAFRAGGYSPDDAARYIRKLKAKIAEGLALPERPTDAARRH